MLTLSEFPLQKVGAGPIASEKSGPRFAGCSGESAQAKGNLDEIFCGVGRFFLRFLIQLFIFAATFTGKGKEREMQIEDVYNFAESSAAHGTGGAVVVRPALHAFLALIHLIIILPLILLGLISGLLLLR